MGHARRIGWIVAAPVTDRSRYRPWTSNGPHARLYPHDTAPWAYGLPQPPVP